MPVNSPVGFYTAFFATVTGFALIWQIWWLAALGLVGAFVGFVVFAWRDVHEFHVPAEEVARVDRARRAAREALLERLAAAEGRCREPRSTLPATVETIRRVREDPHRLGHRGHGAEEPVEGAGHGETGPAQQADHRRLRLLDLPAQRHRHVLLLLRGLRGAAGRDGGRADDPRRSWRCRGSRWRPAALLLSSYTCGLSFAATNARNKLWTQVFLLITGLLGLAFVGLELQEFIALGGARHHAPAQRLPHLLLRPGRPARPARHRRRHVARDHDGAGPAEGLPAARSSTG